MKGHRKKYGSPPNPFFRKLQAYFALAGVLFDGLIAISIALSLIALFALGFYFFLSAFLPK